MSYPDLKTIDVESKPSKNPRFSLLYVDDERDLLMIGKLFLERTGEFKVDILTSAQEALNSPRIQSYDAIISDYQMPGMDGIEFLKAVGEKYGNIPFILFTGRGREKIVIEAINNGADFYVQKGGDPIPQFAELAHKIKLAVQQKKTDISLRESEEKFRVLAESSPVAILVHQDFRYVYVNDYTVRLLGYSKEELYSKYFWEILHPDYQENVKEKGIARSRGECIPPRYEIKYLTESGETHWGDLTAGIIQYKGKPAIIILLVDITEKKKTEEELQAAYEQLAVTEEELRAQFGVLQENLNKTWQSEKNYQSIIEILPGGFYRTDMQGNLILLSPSFAEQFGYSGIEELQGKNIREFFHVNPNDLDKLLNKLEKYGKVKNELISLKRPDGSPFIVSISGHIIYDESDKPAGVEGIIQDITDIVKTEEALRESEEKFRVLAECSSDLILIFDQKLSVTYASPSSLSILGYGPDELLGKNHEFTVAMIFSQCRPDFMNFVQTAMKGETVNNKEIRIIRKDGKSALVSMYIVPTTHNGILTGVQVSIRDVTDRKKADNPGDNEEMFRSFVENANEVLYSLSPDGLIIYISPKITELLGYETSEIIGKSSDLFIHPDDFPRNREFFFQALATGKNLRGNEYRIRHKDGTWMWHFQSITPIYDEEGNLIRVHGISHDITKLKETEEALRKSEEKFRSFVENANDILFSLTPDGITTYVSPKWTELLGHDTDEIIGKPVKHIHPEDFSRVSEFFRQALLTGKKASGIEYRIHHKNGSWQWHTQSISPAFDVEGNVIGVEGICHDITDYKKAEEALRQANIQLNLLSSITRHDILNKITAIRGYLAIAEMECTDANLKEYLQRMKSTTLMIQSQIEFTRIYQDLGSLEPKWIQLDTVMPHSSLPVSVTLITDVKDISIFSDPMLEKVFFNLLDNSVQHGQHVTEIRISVQESDGNLILVWEDNGVGIPEDEKNFIFDRGFGKNTGIGLFLVREILSLTGISIQETGVPGSGARFGINVPKNGWRIT